MGSKHSRARDARQRKYRIERRRVMRELAKGLKGQESGTTASTKTKTKTKADAR